MGIAVLLLLLLVLGQVQVLRWMRDRLRVMVERRISERYGAGLSSARYRIITTAAKYIIPLDMDQNKPNEPVKNFLSFALSSAAGYPEAWIDLSELLVSHAAPALPPEDLVSEARLLRDELREEAQELLGASSAYWYFGVTAWLVGALTVILGAAGL